MLTASGNNNILGVTSKRQVLSGRSSPERPLSVKYRHHQEARRRQLALLRMQGSEEQGTTQPQAKRLYRDPAWHVLRRMCLAADLFDLWRSLTAIAAESCPTRWRHNFFLTWHHSRVTQPSCNVATREVPPCSHVLTDIVDAYARARYFSPAFTYWSRDYFAQMTLYTDVVSTVTNQAQEEYGGCSGNLSRSFKLRDHMLLNTSDDKLVISMHIHEASIGSAFRDLHATVAMIGASLISHY